MLQAVLTIESPARLHVGLLDVGYATPRKYGGIGFTLDRPFAEVTLEEDARGLSVVESNAELHEVVETALPPLRRSFPAATGRLIITSKLPRHIGLGSTTATVLAALIAAKLANNLLLDEEAIRRLSGRGGTSGIGINSFFAGGFIVDGGHRRSTPDRLLPSDAGAPKDDTPPIFIRHEIPGDWRFSLYIPRGNRCYGASERDFFARNAPVPDSEVIEAIALAYHSIVPAVFDADIGLLADSLRRFHSLGFKAREVAAQSETCRHMLAALQTIPGVAAGMSSLGPLLYAIFHVADVKAITALESCRKAFDSDILELTVSGRNHGYQAR